MQEKTSFAFSGEVIIIAKKHTYVTGFEKTRLPCTQP